MKGNVYVIQKCAIPYQIHNKRVFNKQCNKKSIKILKSKHNTLQKYIITSLHENKKALSPFYHKNVFDRK